MLSPKWAGWGFQLVRLSPTEVGEEIRVEFDPVQHCQVLPSQHLYTFLVNRLIFLKWLYYVRYMILRKKIFLLSPGRHDFA